MTEIDKKQEKTWAMACHLSGFAGLLGVPFLNIVGPLVIWLLKKKESALIDANGKEALNFQITFAIYGFVAFITTFILIGVILLPALVIAWVVLVVIASVKTSNGEDYRYPLTIRFIN